MNKKQIKQTMFALCTAALFTTGCSNDVLTSQEGNGSEDWNATVAFSLGLPGSDEVDYTRAGVPLQDASEWTIKTLKVYHFSSAEATPTDEQYNLVTAYNVPVKEIGSPAIGQCVKTGDAKYSLQLSLRSKAGVDEKHVFAFIANDSCSSYDTKIEEAMTDGEITSDEKAEYTLAKLKECIADKQLQKEDGMQENNSANETLFMGDPAGLCMTAILTHESALTSGTNALGAVDLKRIMARLDVKNFVAENRSFKLLSVRVKYNATMGAPKGYLFEGQTANIWSTTEAMEITQHSKYVENGYPTYSEAGDMKDGWVSETTLDGRTGTWYKKVLYMYPYPDTYRDNPTPVPEVEVSYILNGWTSTATVPMNNVETGNQLNIKRNYVYYLQVGETSAPGDDITFTFTDAPWTVHQMDVDMNGGTDKTNL